MSGGLGKMTRSVREKRPSSYKVEKCSIMRKIGMELQGNYDRIDGHDPLGKNMEIIMV